MPLKEGEEELSCPDNELYHQIKKNTKTNEENDAVGGLAINGLDGFFITLYESTYQTHVLLVGTMEHVDDIAYIKGYHTEQHVA